MIKNPIPVKIPVKILQDPDLSGYFQELIAVLLQINQALNGDKNLVLISTTEGINAKTTGFTELLKVPTNKNFVPAFVIIRPTSFTSGGKSVQAIASFGGNSATYDDFLNSVTYTVSAAGTYLIDQPNDALQLPIQIGGTSFGMIIETGSNATTETWTVDLFGYYV